MKFLNSIRGYILKVGLALLVCVSMVSMAAPALAIGGSPSHPTEGVPKMQEMKEASEDAIEQEPRNIKEVQEKAKRGPNEVQGDANLETLKTRRNSQSAETVEEQAKELLEDVMK